jgi:hypothetical protein
VLGNTLTTEPPLPIGTTFTPLELDIMADKNLRVDIDQQLQELKGLKASPERGIAQVKLQEAIMWLGMDLKRLGAPNPYPNSKDPTNAVVDPTADGLKL